MYIVDTTFTVVCTVLVLRVYIVDIHVQWNLSKVEVSSFQSVPIRGSIVYTMASTMYTKYNVHV